LNGDEIKAGHDFRDVIECLGQPIPVAEFVGVEIADVPGRQQQRAVALALSDRLQILPHRQQTRCASLADERCCLF
jgi:hypothetical protein